MTDIPSRIREKPITNLKTKIHNAFNQVIEAWRVTLLGPNGNSVDVDADNNLHVEIHGDKPDGTDAAFRVTGIVANNSTSTPLGSNQEFTGAWFDAEEYSNLTVTIFANQNSATEGFKVEWSSDGTNVDDSDTYSIFAAAGAGGGNRQFSFPIPTKYFRVRFVNGTVAQTTFRLQTKIHANRPKPSSHKVKDDVSGENDAELVKAILAGKREDGSFGNATFSVSGSLQVAVTDRQSSVRNRVRVIIPINNVALSGTQAVLYTVTSGKTLYISSFLTSALNTSANDGIFQLRDSTTIRVGFLIPPRVSGSSPAAFSSASPSLPEPLPFTTNVNFVSSAGTIQVSGYMIGYEEPN